MLLDDEGLLDLHGMSAKVQELATLHCQSRPALSPIISTLSEGPQEQAAPSL